MDSFANSYLLDFGSLPKEAGNPQPVRGAMDSSVRWLAPPGEYIKMNVDGAVARVGHKGVATSFCGDATGIYQGASVIVLEALQTQQF